MTKAICLDFDLIILPERPMWDNARLEDLRPGALDFIVSLVSAEHEWLSPPYYENTFQNISYGGPHPDLISTFKVVLYSTRFETEKCLSDSQNCLHHHLWNKLGSSEDASKFISRINWTAKLFPNTLFISDKVLQFDGEFPQLSKLAAA